MNKIKFKNIALVFIIFSFMISIISFVDASSISISATATSLTVGNSATITVTGSDAIGRVNVSSSNSNIISVSQGSLWVEGNAKFTITAKAVGNATITITPVDMATSAGQTASVGAKSITIYSKAVYIDTRSKNNNLATLTIENHEMAFDTNNTSYSLDVSYDVEELNINATPADTKASVKVEGNTGLVSGENIVKVICTAENGTQKVYEIKVNKAKNPDDINANLKSLSVENSKFKNEFTADTLEYLLEDVDGSVDKLLLNYETMVDGAKVEVQGNEKLEIGLNHIKVKVTSKDESVTKEYNLIFYKTEEISALTDVREKTLKDFIKENKLVVLCLVVILILIIVIILLLLKNKKNNKFNQKEEIQDENIVKRRHRRMSELEENSDIKEDSMIDNYEENSEEKNN